jgi:hypothetical protein
MYSTNISADLLFCTLVSRGPEFRLSVKAAALFVSKSYWTTTDYYCYFAKEIASKVMI